jgi:hypothetical protein
LSKRVSALAARFGYVRLKHITYNGDGLITGARNVSFLRDGRFMDAYRYGMFSGHMIGGGTSIDLHIEWRVAVCCWAAQHGTRLDGDFVECGVNTGILSLAVCKYVGFNDFDKSFYLFDTFAGIPESQMSEDERTDRLISNTKYPDCFDLARENFSQFPRARLVRGIVPESLSTVQVGRVAYLSIDMNIAYPERMAIEHFWPKLATGAIVVLDDYGWTRYEAQKETMDEFARSVGVEILTLPTGQGLLVKP